MNNSTFDPFTLESTFDPLGSEPLEPTGQSAYSRRESLEPTGQSAYSRRESLEPTGQSAYSRRESLEPTGQSAYSRQDPPPPPRRRPAPTPGDPAASPPPEIGAGNRLAHLLRPSDQPAANRQRAPACGKATTEPEATTAHLQALEDDIAILTARLDSLHTAVNERLGDQRNKLVKAVAAMLDERLGPRR